MIATSSEVSVFKRKTSMDEFTILVKREIFHLQLAKIQRIKPEILQGPYIQVSDTKNFIHKPSKRMFFVGFRVSKMGGGTRSH